jgi:hypothetical protein
VRHLVASERHREGIPFLDSKKRDGEETIGLVVCGFEYFGHRL